MIFLFAHMNCPSCGAAGSPFKGMSDVLRCACCNAVYSEFAVISEGKEQEEFEPS